MSALTGGAGAQAYLQGLVKKIQDAGVLRVGFLENAQYDDGTQVAEVAAKNEYGTIDNPMRPFFRTMVKQKKASWSTNVANVMAANNYDIDKTFNLVGEKIVGQLRDSIQGWTTPPNSQQTIDRKGFNKPLIDTAHMLNSAAYDYGVKNEPT
jgi:hypothetical protein